MSNRHEKYKTLELLLRADFLHIFKILHFSTFSKIINSACKKSLKSFCFWLDMVEELDRTGSIHFATIHISQLLRTSSFNVKL